MTRRTKKVLPPAVTWLSEQIVDPNCLSNSFRHFEKFQFQSITASIGDFVLISNADAAEPDTEDGCDAARIVSLYEDSTNKNDPFRAKVQWYSKPGDLPDWFKVDSVTFLDKEVIEDHRPFNTDVSIETFYKKCSINFTYTKDTDHFITAPYNYICRYRLLSMTKRKINIEPVMEEERRAIQLLKTPAKAISSPRSKTPTSLVKRMGRVSLSEQNWSISKTEGTKLLLKKAILTDKIEKDTPKKTPRNSISDTPKRNRSISRSNLEDIVSMELKKTSDEEFPTLIIRQNATPKGTTTPKRTLSTRMSDKALEKELKENSGDELPTLIIKQKATPKRRPSTNSSIFNEEKTPRSARTKKINYVEEEISPVKRTPRRGRNASESDNEFRPTTPVRALQLEVTKTLRRSRRMSVNEETSPVKRTPRNIRKASESDDEFRPKTPLRTLQLDDTKKSQRRTRRMSVNEETSPVKRTRNIRKASESDNEFRPTTPVRALQLEVTKTPRRSRRMSVNEETSPTKRTRNIRKASESDDEFRPKTPLRALQLEVNKTQRRSRSMSVNEETSPVKRTPRNIRKASESDNELRPTTPVRALQLDDTKKSQRTRRMSVNEEATPVKRTPRNIRKASESDDEFRPKTPLRAIQLDDTKKSQRRTRRMSVDEEATPVKRTPRNIRKVSESDDEFRPKTPLRALQLDTNKTPRKSRRMSEYDERPVPSTPKTPKTPRTPRSVSRKIISQLTPSLRERAHSIDQNGKLNENNSLPGRENQMDEILSFVRSKLLDGTSGCMYISGVPGTGKTATVCSALKILKNDDDLPDFQLVEVNGMRIAEPRQAYVQIYKQLTGKSVVWEQACSLLEKRFTNPGSKRIPTVLLVDELDALCTRRQDVLYSIMEWAAHNTALLTVLAVANTMDLPERALAARVASRLGLTRLTFPPYTHTQLMTIVATRLAGANVTPDAVQLIARKVAAVSGDARRALALCTRAVELAGPGGAGLAEVQKALGEAASGAAVTAIKHCSPAELLILRAVAAEVERTGSDETTLSRALSTAAAIVALDGRPYRSAPSIRAPTPSQAKAICSRLAALRLLLLEPKPSEPRLLLNVSADDVHYATRQIVV